ncbi:MAG: cell division topological specificity factor MinE [Synergistetes bacterium]|nr:cell division topological specificity factor MinE [Synergistota bacterium]
MLFVFRLFKRKVPSSKIAKDRLEIILKHDRTELSRSEMIEMTDRILSVLRDYVSYDEDRAQVKVMRKNGETFLYISVPVVGKSTSRAWRR